PPHVLAEGDDDVVQLDGGVEIVLVAGLLEVASEEEGARAQVAEGLAGGVGPDERLGGAALVPAGEKAEDVGRLLPGEAAAEAGSSGGGVRAVAFEAGPAVERRGDQLQAPGRARPAPLVVLCFDQVGH